MVHATAMETLLIALAIAAVQPLKMTAAFVMVTVQKKILIVMATVSVS